MRRLIPLAFVLTACGGDGGIEAPELVQPDRLVIVAGDGQIAPVAGTGTGGMVAAVEGVLPDTLIARIEGSVELSPSITGPGLTLASASLTFPAGTSVEYVVLTEGCGRPYIAAATPDEEGEVRTLWEIPVGALPRPAFGWQGDVWGVQCEMEARAKVANEFRADTTFVAVFTPGDVSETHAFQGGVQWEGAPARMYPDLVDDRYNNWIPYVLESGCTCVAVEGTFSEPRDWRTVTPLRVGQGAIRVVMWPDVALATGTVTVNEDDHGILRAVVRFE